MSICSSDTFSCENLVANFRALPNTEATVAAETVNNRVGAAKAGAVHRRTTDDEEPLCSAADGEQCHRAAQVNRRRQGDEGAGARVGAGGSQAKCTSSYAFLLFYVGTFSVTMTSQTTFKMLLMSHR